MKIMMLAAAAVLISSQAFAGTVIKEGPRGTAEINRVLEDGVLNADGTITAKNGAVYERSTTCVKGECATNWTLTDRKGRMSSGERSTVRGDGKSTTVAERTTRRGETRGRVIERTRSISR
ncbi:MAG: hypothetical protein ACU0GG_19540 [Paracoccaceae bacterium]